MGHPALLGGIFTVACDFKAWPFLKGKEEIYGLHQMILIDAGGSIFNLFEERRSVMQKTLPGYSWFMISCSWEPEEDADAVAKFGAVYGYLELLTDDQKLAEYKNRKPDDPIFDLDADSFKALNLIGMRQFVMIGQATSNRLQQQLALDIGLGTRIRVEVFPATYVHDLQTVMPSTLTKT
jgi:hypothetical protein